jgi:guanylate kinase
MKKGKLIIISGPSGAGKTTISKKMLAQIPSIRYSVSATTRPPRKGEINGRDYFFVSEAEFSRMARKGQFAESASVHGHRYGTPKKFLREAVDSGKNILLDIDVQGGRKLRKLYPRGVFIFILPPSLVSLEKRLRKRAKDNAGIIRTRLNNAKKEIKEIGNYDYLVVNDKLDDALAQLKSIIRNSISGHN